MKLNKHWQRIAFVASVAERHYLNFALFADMVDAHLQGQFYRKALNKVWEYLQGQLKSTKNIESTLAEFETMIPNEEGVDSYGVYPAIDASVVLVSALQMILDKSIDDADQIGELSKSTVADFICLAEDIDEFEPESMEHELYTAELDYQAWVIEQLDNGSDNQTETIKLLRRDVSNQEMSNLGITLESHH